MHLVLGHFPGVCMRILLGGCCFYLVCQGILRDNYSKAFRFSKVVVGALLSSLTIQIKRDLFSIWRHSPFDRKNNIYSMLGRLEPDRFRRIACASTHPERSTVRSTPILRARTFIGQLNQCHCQGYFVRAFSSARKISSVWRAHFTFVELFHSFQSNEFILASSSSSSSFRC